jgi:hypothetical protein
MSNEIRIVHTDGSSELVWEFTGSLKATIGDYGYFETDLDDEFSYYMPFEGSIEIC